MSHVNRTKKKTLTKNVPEITRTLRESPQKISYYAVITRCKAINVQSHNYLHEQLGMQNASIWRRHITVTSSTVLLVQ